MRKSNQNALFHALCNDASHAIVWDGRKLNPEAWKRLFVDSWARVANHPGGTRVPSLDGCTTVQLTLSTSDLEPDEFASLIRWVIRFFKSQQVRLRAPEKYAQYPEASRD